MRRPALTLLFFAVCCLLPGSALAAPWSFIVEPTDQLGVPGYPAGTEITPEGYLYTGSAEIVFNFGPFQGTAGLRDGENHRLGFRLQQFSPIAAAFHSLAPSR